jgi:hypothetical protein
MGTIGSKVNAMLESVLKDKDWCWPPARSEEMVDLQSKQALVQVGVADIPEWVISKKGIYYCAETWEVIRTKHAEVKWWRPVWYPLAAISRHAFIFWLSIRNSLTMGEKLLSSGYQGDFLCPFCQGCTESRDHIFLFFFSVVSVKDYGGKLIIQKCSVEDPKIEREEIIEWGVKSLKGKVWRSHCVANITNQ